eukprot:3929656-Rhodomonas_salina.4
MPSFKAQRRRGLLHRGISHLEREDVVPFRLHARAHVECERRGNGIPQPASGNPASNAAEDQRRPVSAAEGHQGCVDLGSSQAGNDDPGVVVEIHGRIEGDHDRVQDARLGSGLRNVLHEKGRGCDVEWARQYLARNQPGLHRERRSRRRGHKK